MEITINLQSPDLAAAILALAAALGGQAQMVGYAATHQPTVPTGFPTHPEQAVPAQYAPPATRYQPEQPAPTAPAAPMTAVPTSAQAYTMEQLAVAATQLVDAGRRTELVGLLSSFGVQALTALPKEQYGAFATQLRAMGAKI